MIHLFLRLPIISVYIGVSLDDRLCWYSLNIVGVNVHSLILCWNHHIQVTCKKVAASITAIKRVNPFVPPEMQQVIYNALVQLCPVYCSPVLGNRGGGTEGKAAKISKWSSTNINGSNLWCKGGWRIRDTCLRKVRKRRDSMIEIDFYV